MADTALPRSSVRRRRRTSLARQLVEAAVVMVLVFVAVRLGIQNFKVEGGSMEPTLHDNELIIVDKFDYLLHAPHRGDIVVFRAVPALAPDKDFIKRVIGVPGDKVSVHDGAVYLNGRRLAESYIAEPPRYTLPPETVPQDDYFVLGDHRNDSFDSARWPTTPWLARKYIIGKALLAYWPLPDFGLLSSISLR